MKKIWLSLSLLGVFALSYWLGWESKEWPIFKGDTSSSASKTSFSNHVSSVFAAKPSSASALSYLGAKDVDKAFRELITKAHGAKLFEALFDKEILQEYAKFSLMHSALQARFSSSYPVEAGAYQQELITRMGLLKAMQKKFTVENSSENRDSLIGFYRGLAVNQKENWLVRRQSMQNLARWMKFLKEEDKNKIFAATSGRVLATATFSEADILEEIFKRD